MLPATLEVFPPHPLGKHGLNPRCRACKRIDDAERRNRPDQKARQKAWRDANRDKVRATNQAYRASGYRSTEAVAAWRVQHIEQSRKREREYQAKRRKDPAYRLLTRIRARIRSMVSGRAGRSTEQLLGYTMEEFRAHIERQFTDGMCWERIGEIHIDHIIPVSRFKIASIDDPEFRACWALSNLQPLWAKDNLSKNAKVITLL
jgi:hypothetical protein